MSKRQHEGYDDPFDEAPRAAPVKPQPLTITQLTARIRGLLENDLGEVHVQGEISGWSAAASGHCYFSLKDDNALLGAVLWKGSRARLGFNPGDGMKVECRGRLSVYDKRGQYQLVVESMRKAGEGELWQRFQQLKARLEAEGLFAAARKRPIPVYPRAIGLVTSPTGAAIRDMLTVSRRRAPGMSILIAAARVQGSGAGKELAEAVRLLSQSGRVDVIIVGRGGGSFEDLFEFQSEELARAIFESPVPVISAVGHETDFSISDFVADLRAPTPSAAAEIVTTGFVNLHQEIQRDLQRMRRAVEGRLREVRLSIQSLLASHALRRPEMTLRTLQQRVDTALQRMPLAIQRRTERLRARLERSRSALEGHNPELILKKGYAIVRRTKDGHVLPSATPLKRNMPVDLQFHDGNRRAIVTDDTAEDMFC